MNNVPSVGRVWPILSIRAIAEGTNLNMIDGTEMDVVSNLEVQKSAVQRSRWERLLMRTAEPS